jgi:hypothetical protein
MGWELSGNIKGPPGSGGGGEVEIAAVTIDFGALGSWSLSTVVTASGVSASSKVLLVQAGAAAGGRDADENEMEALLLRADAKADNFVLYADAVPGPAHGEFLIYYTIG